MEKKEIERIVRESFGRFLESKNVRVNEIDYDSCPIRDFGLDSPDGIDWVCDLEDYGIMVPIRVNPFVDDESKQPRNIGEIVELLLNIL